MAELWTGFGQVAIQPGGCVLAHRKQAALAIFALPDQQGKGEGIRGVGTGEQAINFFGA